MSISERPADAQIELYSGVASLELSVVAADFTTVASGLGNLSTAVPPGIYQVVVRAGPVIDRTLITVGPGETYRANNLSVRFPAPAPVSDTSTSHEYHQAAVEQASGKLGQMPGPPSGLVLVVRDVRGMEGPPLLPTDLACFSLLDEHLNPLPGFDQGWQLQSHEAIATWSGRLAAGGYALRTDPRLLVGGERMPTTSQIFDQSLWLSDNWQTIVFITTGQGGPQTSAASIHMGQLGIGWSPFDTQVGLALELANWGLREGRSVVPNDLLNVLLNSKYVNPMLGIVGAHSLLLSSEVNWDVVETVIHNLELLVPGHPDVIALRWMAARGRASAGMAAPPPTAPAAPAVPAVPAVPVGSASWPPMLLSSYRALIAMDAVDANAIANGSPAELAAAQLLVQGIWTSWQPIVIAPPPPLLAIPPPPVLASPPRRRFGWPRWRRDDVPLPTSRPLSATEVLPAIAADPAVLSDVRPDDPATERVAGYLTALAALEGESGRQARFGTLSPQEIALATTLPVATVDRSLTSIASQLPPLLLTGAGGGAATGGGGGISAGLGAAFVAVVVLLIGAAGVTAWCAGDQSCPLRISVQPAATEPPTEPPTAAPSPTPPATPTPEPTATPGPAPSPSPLPLAFPPTLDFGRISIGGEPSQQSAVITAPEPVDFRAELVDDAGGVFALGEPCTWRPMFAGGWVCATSVTFTPRAETRYVGAMTLVVAGEPDTRQIQLLGVGVPLILRFEPTLEFDVVTIGFPATRTVTISASEPGHLEFAEVDDPAGVFAPVVTSCDLAFNESGLFQCFVDVALSPIAESEYFGALGIFTGDLEVGRVTLHGFGNPGIT